MQTTDYITSLSLLNKGSELALKPFQQASCFGLDCETAFGIDPYRAKVRLVQLAPDRPVVIVDLFAIAMQQASHFRKKFFESYTGIKQFHALVRSAWSRGIRESRTVLGRRRLWSKDTKPLLNEMLNNPIQGMSADITKLALALIFSPLICTDAKLICMVHDEILIECPIEEVKPVKAMLKKCMVRAGNKFLSPIPCEVEIKVMESWGG